MSLKEIIEGWKNYLIPDEELKEEISRVSKERLNVCKGCEFNSTKGKVKGTSFCKDCKCQLKAKAACLSCECPKGKWKKVADLEDEIEMTLRKMTK